MREVEGRSEERAFGGLGSRNVNGEDGKGKYCLLRTGVCFGIGKTKYLKRRSHGSWGRNAHHAVWRCPLGLPAARRLWAEKTPSSVQGRTSRCELRGQGCSAQVRCLYWGRHLSLPVRTTGTPYCDSRSEKENLGGMVRQGAGWDTGPETDATEAEIDKCLVKICLLSQCKSDSSHSLHITCAITPSCLQWLNSSENPRKRAHIHIWRLQCLCKASNEIKSNWSQSSRSRICNSIKLSLTLHYFPAFKIDALFLGSLTLAKLSQYCLKYFWYSKQQIRVQFQGPKKNSCLEERWNNKKEQIRALCCTNFDQQLSLFSLHKDDWVG